MGAIFIRVEHLYEREKFSRGTLSRFTTPEKFDLGEKWRICATRF